MKKSITLAKHAGFCYGVKRAVETTKKIKAENPIRPICVLGELIHNSDVINELSDLGIKTVYDVPTCFSNDECGVCVIRSHGLAQSEIDRIAEKGYEVVDLTCIDVKKVQQKAMELAKDGSLVIIVGKSEHPEVMAISANARMFSDDVYVVSDVDEITDELSSKIRMAKCVGVVSQTTQQIENLQKIVAALTALTKELKVYNTICASTSKRQNEARELAKNSDLMVVVGSKKSANTTHLAEILKNITQTIHIENEQELDSYAKIVSKAVSIGVTAGASTPQNVIDSVLKKLEIQQNHNL
ncbi:4-hydroxy-3-methylbut-2-enyl diphosphate reductase [bacterium]|nr:4-hydroxy-3-methylbut-2-enyl diphosphate reductase [bacterium]